MKRETFIAGMSTLSATFGRPLEDAALEGYWIGLAKLEDAEFLGAMRAALEECKYMPPPSELLGFARKQREKAQRLEAMKLADEIKRELAAPQEFKVIEGEKK